MPKASTDITCWPLAIRAGVELRTRCRVREISTHAQGMATGVVYFDPEDKEHFQPAEVVVPASNGVGTPRLLPNSTSSRFPNGLANSSGLVGRNLMFHPHAGIHGTFHAALDGHRGPGNLMCSQEFHETDAARDFVRGDTFEFTHGRGPVMTALSGTGSGRIPWGAGHPAAYRRLHDRITGRVAICEDLPEEHNRVTLDPVLTHGGWHLMGTARMGTDPERSVVNEWSRSHDVKNLFIVDGSIFVASVGVNPTATIQALALYSADNIEKRLANLFDSSSRTHLPQAHFPFELETTPRWAIPT